MRAATMNATSPVVWPGCVVATPASPAFQQSKAGRVKAKPVQPIVRESSSARTRAGVPRERLAPPRSHLHWRAMAGHGSRPSATRAGLVAREADRALVQTGVSPGSTALGKGPSSKQQVKRSLDGEAPGPDAFQLLLRHLAEHFDVGDRQESFLRLQQLGAADGIPFADYLRAFRFFVSSVTGSERTLVRSVSMVLEIVRNSVDKQFPSLAPLWYPGVLATAVTPFKSIAVIMCEAFAPLATNKTPAIGGSSYFSLTSTRGSLQPRRSNHRAPGQWASGSAQNPVDCRCNLKPRILSRTTTTRGLFRKPTGLMYTPVTPMILFYGLLC
ncbi:unnamed protein product [Ectocarpus sp. CCAP 1310/34]|nr:unnamed protein product [Ectocarpus sp. CCAP 1310/34]